MYYYCVKRHWAKKRTVGTDRTNTQMELWFCVHFCMQRNTVGFMKRVCTMYTFYIFYLSIPLHKISWAIYPSLYTKSAELTLFRKPAVVKKPWWWGGGVINKSTSIYFVPWCLVYQAAQVLKTGSSYPKQNILKTTNSFKQTKIPVSKNNPKGQEKDLLGMLRLAFLSCVVEKKIRIAVHAANYCVQD